MSFNKTSAWGLVLPLTIISMFLVTKWWFALPLDGPDKLYWGFPFAFIGEGFHTSMSFQVFILEWLADFLFYFFFWLVLLFLVNRFFPKFIVPRFLIKIGWYISIFLLIAFGFVLSSSNPIFHAKRDYKWTIMQTGHVFIWQATPRPDINQLRPLKNN